MESDGIIRRIEEAAGIAGLAEILAQHVSPTDLQSLLLAVFRKRSARRTPADVLADYERNRFVAPSQADPDQLAIAEAELKRQLPAPFKSIELSPVCPLGTSAVLAGVSQDWSVPTVRNTEVLSDATNVLALECALRRRNALKSNPRSSEAFHYCSSHRLLRPQFSDSPDLLTHFRLFHVCSAGRDSGNLGFECDAIFMQASAYLAALRRVVPTATNLEFLLTDFHEQDRYPYLETNLLDRLRDACHGVRFVLNRKRDAGRGYYRDLCFHIYAHPRGASPLQLADGGSVDWTQKMLGNAKERLIISAISAERMCSLRESA